MTDKVEALLERQIRAWPLLAKGVVGLARATTRPVRINWFEVFVRHIPHRVASTTAAVDRESVAQRPCFLCAANLPAEEEGLRFNEEFTIYCNPFPIVDRHLTIASREHRPQRISGQLGNLLDLAAALPGYFAIYNGPECGASAPDHMHFQAGSRILFPIAEQTARIAQIDVSNYSRNVFIHRGQDRSELISQLERNIELLQSRASDRAEPLLNIASFFERGAWTVYLFPRKKHRPDVYYTGELTVSPASIDLCGIFVVPLVSDFEKITGSMIDSIFREITLPDDEFHEVLEELESE